MSAPSRAVLGLVLVIALFPACAKRECAASDAAVVAATPPDPPLSCPVELPADAFASKRAACEFTTGATVADTLGISPELSRQIPIRHIIVAMRENRSFDHLLGHLHDQGQPDTEPIPERFVNVDRRGAKVRPYRADTTCIRYDPAHQWDAMHAGVNGGAMDGFVKSAAESTGTIGHFVMSNYTEFDLPFYYWMARTWALNDRHFSSVRSGTHPNRLFVLLGTNDGVRQTDGQRPDPSTPSLLQLLGQAGYTWAIYASRSPYIGDTHFADDIGESYCFESFIERLDSGTLPSVSFVDGGSAIDDDEPGADLQAGEAFMARIYRHAVQSPQWPSLAIIWVYDESGGFADHVPPPNNACVPRPVPQDAPFVELGVRVPFVVISPYAKPHYVSHVVQEHTVITRFIETVFDLPALTARDANSPALLDLFDFSCAAPMLQPPPAPAAGVNGCSPFGPLDLDIGNGM